jgi:hypothetical protein
MNRTKCSSAERVKRHRRRQRAGLAVFRVAVPEHAAVQALLQSGRLTPEAALDRRQVECALAEVFVEWSTRWPA